MPASQCSKEPQVETARIDVGFDEDLVDKFPYLFSRPAPADDAADSGVDTGRSARQTARSRPV